MGKVEDLTGQRFNMLTVIKRADNYVSPHGKTYSRWECLCDCGNTTIVSRGQLKNGGTRSCGCYQKQQVSELGKRAKKYNEDNLDGQYGICYASNTHEEILFDLDDYEKIKDYCWKIEKPGKTYKRVSARSKEDSHSPIRLHRLIMGVNDPNIQIDHINRNPLDNRKENLRICSMQENLFNRAAYNKYKVKGVWRNRQNKYQASIRKDGHVYYLGTFPTIKEASDAYDKKAIELFGEFACLNNYQEDTNDLDKEEK